jgi:UDPglucose 6-dehydrogenase
VKGHVGWIGLGKLGLPCAVTLARHTGRNIVAYDTNTRVFDYLEGLTHYPHREAGLDDYLGAPSMTTFTMADSIADVVSGAAELVFVAVPTPHDPEYGGEQPMPDEVRDFDYTALCEVIEDIGAAAAALNREITVVVVSTVLPGTVRGELLPLVHPGVRVLYNPFFIAMGTTVHDFLNPEFVLIGHQNPDEAKPLVELYHEIHSAPVRLMNYESAELTKVAYNTFISQKITFANTLMEICDGIGADVDDVTRALRLGHQRITGPAYLSAGMGDGGACHPRDNIAMAWLAAEFNVSADPFTYVTRAREQQSKWLATKIIETRTERADGLPIVLLGKTYKPNTDLTTGSPALLLSYYLTQAGFPHEHWDPNVDSEQPPGVLYPRYPALFVITTRHPIFATWQYPIGSVVIDPFRYIDDQPSVRVFRLGEGVYR